MPGRPDRSRDFVIPLLGAVLTFALWDSALLFPLKIFTVFLHEASHGLAAVLTGGAIERIEISPNEGGVCFTRGGSAFVVASAGYLGSLAFGVLFLLVATRSRHDRAFLGLVGVSTFMLTLVYVRTGFGLLYGLLAGLGLVAVAAWLPNGVSDLLLRIVGTVSALYAVWDIASDVLTRDVPGSDANALAALTGIPGVVWGLLWSVVSLTVLALVFRSTLR